MGSGISSNRKAPTSVSSERPDTAPVAHVATVDPQAETLVSISGARTDDRSQTPEIIEYPPNNMNNEEISPNEGEVGLAIAVTPRENEKSSASNSFSGVPYTPHGDEASVFKYYCPLCMQYFKQIMKMKCCGNYLCVQCCKDYVGRKGVHLSHNEGITQIEDRFISSNSMYCPHCQVSGFHPLGVSFEEAVRDYYQSHSVPQQDRGTVAYSPLRIGESFEDLKRKMIPYKSFQIIKTISDDGTHDSEAVQPYDSLSPAYLLENNVLTGIAMMPNPGEETPLFRSPRMRLESDTPGQMQLCLYHPDLEAAGGGNRLFPEEHSGPFSHDQIEAINESSSHSNEISMQHGPHINAGVSPRIASVQPIDRSLETTPADVSRSSVPVPAAVDRHHRDRPPLSRVGSAARVGATDESGVISRHGSEKARLRGHCSHVATNLVEQLVCSALAQYPSGEREVSQ